MRKSYFTYIAKSAYRIGNQSLIVCFLATVIENLSARIEESPKILNKELRTGESGA